MNVLGTPHRVLEPIYNNINTVVYIGQTNEEDAEPTQDILQITGQISRSDADGFIGAALS